MSKTEIRLGAFTDLLPGAVDRLEVVDLDVDSLAPSPVQVRPPFDPRGSDEDRGLLESVRQDGVLQPLLVTVVEGEDKFRIIAGHRRWAAAKAAGLGKVPCIVLEVDDAKAAFYTALENVQRLNLSPLEEAHQYLLIMRAMELSSAAELARRLGKPSRTVQLRLSLLRLPRGVRELLASGLLTEHQALGCNHEAWGGEIARLAVEYGLSRREIDEVARRLAQNPDGTPEEVLKALKREPRRPTRRRGKRTAPPPADYEAVVADLNIPLTEEQRDLLARHAETEGLDPDVVRWAGLLIVASNGTTMPVSAAVVYAQQLFATPVGKALRAVVQGTNTLERRMKKADLTPNRALALVCVVEDLIARLGVCRSASLETLR
ncbi:MAG TPA: ParB/RepB/Spo0J family partition protein [Anaerolineae bacterium]|nr:ParB/RepB/Spo0J family partition protein [Anaerolineae bacterium]